MQRSHKITLHVVYASCVTNTGYDSLNWCIEQLCDNCEIYSAIQEHLQTFESTKKDAV